MEDLDKKLEEVIKTHKEKVQKRLSSNLEIIKILSTIISKHPELRFTQILFLLSLNKCDFNEESVDTLHKLEKFLEKMGE